MGKSEMELTEKEREFTCLACGRKFQSTPEDVEKAGGHLCIAADIGLSQHDALASLDIAESQKGNG